MPRRLHIAACALCLTVASVRAQTSNLFGWQFDSAAGASVPSCEELKVTILPNNDGDMLGEPPFYMIAYATDGLPQTSFLGDDIDNLAWTVSFPPTSELLLNVVDSQESSGGTPQQLLNVVSARTSRECVPESIQNPSNDFTVTSRVDDTLETCAPWELSIKGGVPPYTVSLNALDSPVSTNLTGGTTPDTLFTYINRALPGSDLLAGVSDSTGRWAFGTPIVTTFGGSDTECNGIGSDFVSGTGTTGDVSDDSDQTDSEDVPLDQPDSEASAGEDDNETAKVGVLLAAILTPILALLLAGGLYFYFWRKRRQPRPSPLDPPGAQDTQPFPFVTIAARNDLERGKLTAEDTNRRNTLGTTISFAPGPRSETSVVSVAGSMTRAGSGDIGHDSLSYATTDRNEGGNEALASIQEASRAVTAPWPTPVVDPLPSATTADTRRTSHSSVRKLPSPPMSQASPTQSALPHPPHPSGSMTPFQHTDAGTAQVRESLPPPYMFPSSSGIAPI